MPKVTEITYEFVDSAPGTLQPGVLYISTKYRAIVHLCLCGCGEKVLLTLDSDPESWSFTFDGRSISVHDSVGNLGLPCRSHYIVRKSRVEWLPPLMSVDPAIVFEPRLCTEGRLKAPKRIGHSRWLPWRRRHSGSE